MEAGVLGVRGRSEDNECCLWMVMMVRWGLWGGGVQLEGGRA